MTQTATEPIFIFAFAQIQRMRKNGFCGQFGPFIWLLHAKRRCHVLYRNEVYPSRQNLIPAVTVIAGFYDN